MAAGNRLDVSLRTSIISQSPIVLIYVSLELARASLVAQWQRICLPMQETWVPSLGWKEPLQKEMATHSVILAWKIPWTEEPGNYSPWCR